MAKKKTLIPRRLRMNRSSRLSSARHWLATQKGRTSVQIAKSYRKHYGVDWPCALQEVGTLGIRLPDHWVAQLQQSLAGDIGARTSRRHEREQLFDPDSDEQFAWIAGYTPNGVPFGITWEERENTESKNILKRPSENEERNERIDNEIIVDCYNEEERAMGWYCYAESNMAFPFKALCIAKRATSPLKIKEAAEVQGMASEDDCLSEIMVLITWADETLAIPLAQLEPVSTSTEKTRQVVADWHYWVARGWEF